MHLHAVDEESRYMEPSSAPFTQNTAYKGSSFDQHENVGPANNSESKSERRGLKRYTSGWRFSAIVSAIAATIVFLINLIATILAVKHSESNSDVLFETNCKKARELNKGLHFVINILSVVLLSSSNFCMQILSAPTRREVDRAHAKGQWLDIGILSIHNLRKISRHRVVLWALLGISSLPLHLLYNSAIFLSISTNDYFTFSVRESFINSLDCGDCGKNTQFDVDCYGNTTFSDLRADPDQIPDVVRNLQQKARNHTLDRLSNLECINEYAQSIQSTRRNLFLVFADDTLPEPSTTKDGLQEVYAGNFRNAYNIRVSFRRFHDPYSWMCKGREGFNPKRCVEDIPDIKEADRNESCRYLVSEFQKAPDDWRMPFSKKSYPVDHCLAEEADERCKIQVLPKIAIIVTALNLFKAILIFYVVFGVKENPLLTIGDAVASFLEKKDDTTRGMCLLSVKEVKKHGGYFPVRGKEWKGKVYRWKNAASRTRRRVTFTIWILVIIIFASLFGFGHSTLRREMTPISKFAALGYGEPDPQTIIQWKLRDTIPLVLVANSGQILLSFTYYCYNGLFTAMLMGYEWASYSTTRKGLRVSRPPHGSQRSTYFLQLPYRFAVPLMGLSILLHWLMSQSIFLVAVEIYDHKGVHQPDRDWKSCGFSPIAILTLVIVGVIMTAAAFGAGRIPYKKGMNLVGSCSAAISATCHILDESEVSRYEAAKSKLQWGVVETDGDGVGHCAFSAKEVEMPKVGQTYA